MNDNEIDILESLFLNINEYDKQKPNNFNVLRNAEHIIYAFVNKSDNIHMDTMKLKTITKLKIL